MALLDKLKGVGKSIADSVETGVKSVSDGGKRMSDKMKINKEINNAKAEIERTYCEIGRKYVELNGTNPGEEYIAGISRIAQLSKNIAEYEESLMLLDGKVRCSSCNNIVSNDSLFCSSCGGRLKTETTATEQPVPPDETPSEPPTVNEVKVICPHCNNTAKSDSTFCGECGGKLVV